jgi:hypothetical protein
MSLWHPKAGKSRSNQPSFPVPALTEMLVRRGFAYEGFTRSEHFRGNEVHRFSRGTFAFSFAFANSIYGDDQISIEVPEPSASGGRGSAYLSYFVDYALERNALRESGLTHEEALARCLEPHVEYVTQLAAIAGSHGRVIPLRADRIELENVGAER